MWRARLHAPAREEPRAIAQLSSAFGQVTLERDGHREVLRKSAPLQRLDTVETGAESEATLTLANGEQVRVLENSVIFTEIEGGRPVLIVKSGDLWAEQATEDAKSILISREGSRTTLAQDLEQRTKKAGTIAKIKKIPARREALPSTSRSRLETLTADYIQETLRTQRNLFFKCYGQLLQRTPGVSGEASVAFTIERTGRVTAADVASSSLPDAPFRRCLTDAVKRIEFKSFAGEPVQTLFPLRFE